MLCILLPNYFFLSKRKVEKFALFSASNEPMIVCAIDEDTLLLKVIFTCAKVSFVDDSRPFILSIHSFLLFLVSSDILYADR